MKLPKGWTELEMVPTGKPKLMDIKARAFIVRTNLVDSHKWFTAETLFADEAEGGTEPNEEDFFAVLRQVSRRSKPSSPGEAPSKT